MLRETLQEYENWILSCIGRWRQLNLKYKILKIINIFKFKKQGIHIGIQITAS